MNKNKIVKVKVYRVIEEHKLADGLNESIERLYGSFKDAKKEYLANKKAMKKFLKEKSFGYQDFGKVELTVDEDKEGHAYFNICSVDNDRFSRVYINCQNINVNLDEIIVK